jgi:hypothetical protein
VSSRLLSARSLLVAWIVALILGLIPIATALADGTGTFYPH